jgi:malate dehydrogenase (oxaloacetate-decarboxylating)(NADP+)
MVTKNEALSYHKFPIPGKLGVVATKPCITQRDLSLAYTPGVADPCLEIEKDPKTAYEYTNKGNLVAVVTNGTAVLGLGSIGAMAGKPVMEGKGVLFKRFAGIDVFDIELNTLDPDELIRAVQMLEPTFGGINLEDIKAPECFYIEEKLKETTNIPIFHDDQHGTAIISAAAMLNALELANKNIADIKVVVSGAGAAGIACTKLYISLGVRKENVYLIDSKGVIRKDRFDFDKMPEYKQYFAQDTKAETLAEAMVDADLFCGVSLAGLVTKDMVRSMADNPIIFAMANPIPEIMYDEALEVRKDIIMATGRSDFPNQVNNVLGFPFIFRGALDVRASQINEEMKVAATKALAELAKLDVPDSVTHAYGLEHIEFGPEYIIPKPFDPRVLTHVSSAVAKAACDTGVALEPITDFAAYEQELIARLGSAEEILHSYTNKAKYIYNEKPVRIVFPEGANEKIIRAAHRLIEEKIANPILLGEKDLICEQIENMHLKCEEFDIVDIKTSPGVDKYSQHLYNQRKRKGVTLKKANRLMRTNANYHAAAMVLHGDADAMISGEEQYYPDALRPVLETLNIAKKTHTVAGMYMVIPHDSKPYFFSDCTVNINPTAQELANIAEVSAKAVKGFGVEPRLAMLSFSNFGSAPFPESSKVAEATTILQSTNPDLIVDGEMQVTTALNKTLLQESYSFSKLQENANVLIFPNLDSSNIAYKLMDKIGNSTVVGPILLGVDHPVQIVHRNVDVDTIVHMSVISVIQAEQMRNKPK